jgi:hypothetical protein
VQLKCAVVNNMFNFVATVVMNFFFLDCLLRKNINKIADQISNSKNPKQ